MKHWTGTLALAALAAVAPLALGACHDNAPAPLDADDEAALAMVQEELEAMKAVAVSDHFHPDSVPQWWHTVDTIPMDIDGSEAHLRRIARDRYGLSEAEVNLVMERMRAAKRARTGGREPVRAPRTEAQEAEWEYKRKGMQEYFEKSESRGRARR